MQNFLNQIPRLRVNEVLKTCPRKRSQLANGVKLKMNVLAGIASQKVKTYQTEPT